MFKVVLISQASLIAQLVKNLPAMQETQVRFLGQEDPLEKERLPTPAFWPGEFHRLCSPWGHKESDRTERLNLCLDTCFLSLVSFPLLFLWSAPQSRLSLCDPTDCSPRGSSVHGFSRQEDWTGLPFPSPGDLPDWGIEPGSPALQADASPPEPAGKPTVTF